MIFADRNAAIVRLLSVASRPLAGYEISAITRLSSGSLYPRLWRLEEAGTIASEWAPGPAPRARLYRVVVPVKKP